MEQMKRNDMDCVGVSRAPRNWRSSETGILAFSVDPAAILESRSGFERPFKLVGPSSRTQLSGSPVRIYQVLQFVTEPPVVGPVTGLGTPQPGSRTITN